MGDELRVGILGGGMMGCEHVRNFVAMPGVRPVAVADPVASSREAAVTAADGPLATFDDPAALVEWGELDAVVVATPNHTHREVLDVVWGSRLHVLVEKPLCTTVEDCVAVHDAARSHDGVVWMGLEYRYMPAVADFVGRLRSGEAGSVRMLSVREHRFPFLVKVENWNRFNRNTGGTLVEKCCHFFDLMNLVMEDRPVSVMASGDQAVNHLDEYYDGERADILDNAFVIVEYADGRRAMLDLCMFAEGSRFEQELVAVGDRGKLEAHLPNFVEVSRGRTSEVVRGRREDWSVSVEPVEADAEVRYLGGHHGASYVEDLRFCQAIRSGAEPEVTVDDGLWSVAVGVAAHRSADEHRVVEIEEVLATS